MAAQKFLSEKMVSGRAGRVFVEYCRSADTEPTLPVPIDRVAEDLCELSILWEPVPEPPGQTVLAGLVPCDRLVVFNENRRQVFDETPFLYNTVLGHEIGHWTLHVDIAALDHPLLPGFERPFQFVCRRGSDSWEERQAHWFASHLLLPRDMLAAHLAGTDIRTLADMYRLRDRLHVTVTVLRIALEKMGLAYVDEHGTVHPSKQEYHGQLRLL